MLYKVKMVGIGQNMEFNETIGKHGKNGHLMLDLM